MTVQEHEITAGDTRTPLGVVLTQDGDAIDLTGMTVKFKMVREDGKVIVAETDANVTVIDAQAGKVQYAFQDEDVLSHGVFFAWFTVYSSGKRDAIPPGRRFRIKINQFG